MLEKFTFAETHPKLHGTRFKGRIYKNPKMAGYSDFQKEVHEFSKDFKETFGITDEDIDKFIRERRYRL